MTPFSLKSIVRSSILACSVATGVFAPATAVVAQAPTMRLIADIPFEFRSGSELMPAGTYTIDRLGDSWLLLRDQRQTRTQIMPVFGAFAKTMPEAGKLVFHRYGDQYFLFQAWAGHTRDGFQVQKTRTEKEYLRAQNNPVPSNIELALNEEPRR